MNFFNSKQSKINIYPYPERIENKQEVSCDDWKINQKFKVGDRIDLVMDPRSDEDKKKSTYYSPVEYKDIEVNRINVENCTYSFINGTAYYPNGIKIKGASGDQYGPNVDLYGVLHEETPISSSKPSTLVGRVTGFFNKRQEKGGGKRRTRKSKRKGNRKSRKH